MISLALCDKPSRPHYISSCRTYTILFDTIDHEKLIRRLEADFGLSDSALVWLTSYLLGRQQSVRVGEVTSTRTLVTSGVPQGSVLGQVLFFVYISPVGRIIEKCDVAYHSYADDTTLYIRLWRSVGLCDDGEMSVGRGHLFPAARYAAERRLVRGTCHRAFT